MHWRVTHPSATTTSMPRTLCFRTLQWGRKLKARTTFCSKQVLHPSCSHEKWNCCQIAFASWFSTIIYSSCLIVVYGQTCGYWLPTVAWLVVWQIALLYYSFVSLSFWFMAYFWQVDSVPQCIWYGFLVMLWDTLEVVLREIKRTSNAPCIRFNMNNERSLAKYWKAWRGCLIRHTAWKA